MNSLQLLSIVITVLGIFWVLGIVVNCLFVWAIDAVGWLYKFCTRRRHGPDS